MVTIAKLVILASNFYISGLIPVYISLSGLLAGALEVIQQAPNERPTAHCQKIYSSKTAVSHGLEYAWALGHAFYTCAEAPPSTVQYNPQYNYYCDMSGTNSVQNVLLIADKLVCQTAQWSNHLVIPAAEKDAKGRIQPTGGCVKGPTNAVLTTKSTFVTGWAQWPRAAHIGSDGIAYPAGFDNVMMKNIYVQHLIAPTSRTTPDLYFMASDIGTIGQFAADWQICATNTAEQPVTLKIAFVEPPQGYQIG